MGVSFNDREHEYWLVNESDTDMDLAGDMMYSMMFHAKYSPKRDGFLSDWNDYNPDGFTYGSSSKNKNIFAVAVILKTDIFYWMRQWKILLPKYSCYSLCCGTMNVWKI